MTFWFVLSNSTQNGSASGSREVGAGADVLQLAVERDLRRRRARPTLGGDWARRAARPASERGGHDQAASRHRARVHRSAGRRGAAPVALRRAPGTGDVALARAERARRRALAARLPGAGRGARPGRGDRRRAAGRGADGAPRTARSRRARWPTALLQAFFDTIVPGKPVPDLLTELGNPIHPQAIAGVDPEHGAVYTDALALARNPRIGFTTLEPAFLADLSARALGEGGVVPRPRLRGARARLPRRARLLEPRPRRLGGRGGDPVHRLLRRRQRRRTRPRRPRPATR